MNQAYSSPGGFLKKSFCLPHFICNFLAEKHCYNIPEVTAAPHVANWLSEDGVKLLNNCRDDKMLPDFAKLVICRNM